MFIITRTCVNQLDIRGKKRLIGNNFSPEGTINTGAGGSSKEVIDLISLGKCGNAKSKMLGDYRFTITISVNEYFCTGKCLECLWILFSITTVLLIYILWWITIAAGLVLKMVI